MIMPESKIARGFAGAGLAMTMGLGLAACGGHETADNNANPSQASSASPKPQHATAQEVALAPSADFNMNFCDDAEFSELVNKIDPGLTCDYTPSSNANNPAFNATGSDWKDSGEGDSAPKIGIAQIQTDGSTELGAGVKQIVTDKKSIKSEIAGAQCGSQKSGQWQTTCAVSDGEYISVQSSSISNNQKLLQQAFDSIAKSGGVKITEEPTQAIESSEAPAKNNPSAASEGEKAKPVDVSKNLCEGDNPFTDFQRKEFGAFCVSEYDPEHHFYYTDITSTPDQYLPSEKVLRANSVFRVLVSNGQNDGTDFNNPDRYTQTFKIDGAICANEAHAVSVWSCNLDGSPKADKSTPGIEVDSGSDDVLLDPETSKEGAIAVIETILGN